MRTGRQKGNRQRRRCIALLTYFGWDLDVVEKTGKFVKVKDLYGLFDLIALNKSKVQILLIQVTSSEPHNHSKLAEFAQKFSVPAIRIMQFVWIDRKGFDVFEYWKDGNWTKSSCYGSKQEQIDRLRTVLM